MERHLTRRLAVVGFTLLTAASLAACGGGDHDAGANNHGGVTPTVAASSNAAFNETDVAFARDMIPHHQQALEMAQLAETRATNPEVKELAAKIRAAQGPEIATMSAWLTAWGQPLPSSSPGVGHGEHAGMPGMMTDQEMQRLKAASGADFDRLFPQMMIRHHQGAIEMATGEQRQGQHPDAKKLAGKIAADQAAEIAQMDKVLTTL